MRFYNKITRNKKRYSRIRSSESFIYGSKKPCVAFNINIVPRRVMRVIKRKFKKRLIRKKKLKFFIYLRYNYVILYKGKNPRMGKGIGFFVRKVIITSQNKSLFKFKKFNFSRNLKFSIFFRKRCKVKSFSFESKWYY